MSKGYQEWIRQADYDFKTAKFMFKGGRYFYTVFMCHLAIEKILKSLFYKKLKEFPPKTHSLIYLVNKIDIHPPEKIGRFLIKIDQASVVTRYPEDLARLQKDYTKGVVEKILLQTQGTIRWAKTIL